MDIPSNEATKRFNQDENTLNDDVKTTENESAEKSITLEIECIPGIRFSPPVYIQRYNEVIGVLKKYTDEINTVVEFGCAELKFLKYLKSVREIEHIIAVDIDETMMPICKREAEPKLYEYLTAYARKLIVDLFVGDISVQDKRLQGADVVISIELIEHLYPETLDKVPYTIFGFIKPKLAIITTPNADFNVLFDLKSSFRHDDHKFEWTRKEFKNWCDEILKKYTDYEVSYKGVGKGPEGTEHLGCVSQMAVFTLKKHSESNLPVSPDVGETYRLYDRIEYFYKEDERTKDEKLKDEIKYQLNYVAIHYKMFPDYISDDDVFEIPVEHVREAIQNEFDDDEYFLNFLQSNFIVKETENGLVIIHDERRYDNEYDSSENGDSQEEIESEI